MCGGVKIALLPHLNIYGGNMWKGSPGQLQNTLLEVILQAKFLLNFFVQAPNSEDDQIINIPASANNDCNISRRGISDTPACFNEQILSDDDSQFESPFTGLSNSINTSPSPPHRGHTRGGTADLEDFVHAKEQ